MNYRTNLALVASGALLAGCSGGVSSDGSGTGAATKRRDTFTFSGSACQAQVKTARLAQYEMHA